jgi:hypothetical protein
MSVINRHLFIGSGLLLCWDFIMSSPELKPNEAEVY